MQIVCNEFVCIVDVRHFLRTQGLVFIITLVRMILYHKFAVGRLYLFARYYLRQSKNPARLIEGSVSRQVFHVLFLTLPRKI